MEGENGGYLTKIISCINPLAVCSKRIILYSFINGKSKLIQENYRETNERIIF